MTRRSQRRKQPGEQDSTDSAVRIDKWLWASRFYKTRVLSTEAVSAGHVQLNGARVKPSRAVKEGDQLQVKKGGYEHVVDVLDISDKRGSATIARQLYRETDESIQKRELAAANRRADRLSQPDFGDKPDKKSRRERLKFLGKRSVE